MSGLTKQTPIPNEIKLHQKSRLLELAYEDGSRYQLTHEFLRVFTPSAEAQGHGPGEETLQVGKRDVEIVNIEPIGNYAIRPVFSDGHDSGLYSWDVLHMLCTHQEELWQAYLKKLEETGNTREAADYPESSVKAQPKCALRRSS